MVKVEYLKELDYTEQECQSVRQLCGRVACPLASDQEATFKKMNEDTAYAFLGLLEKLKRPNLSDLKEEMLFVLEKTYGLIKVK